MDPSPETIELHATENVEKDFTGSKEPYTTQASDRFSVYSVDLKKSREVLDSNDYDYNNNFILIYTNN